MKLITRLFSSRTRRSSSAHALTGWAREESCPPRVPGVDPRFRGRDALEIGRPAAIRSFPRKRESTDSGYALMVMLIAVSVMTIALLTVLPSAYQEARREREEELLFRGNQYAQAIYLFQKKFNRYPNSVKELLHTDNMSFLRKPWPDPMTPGGKWRFIHSSGTGAVLDSWTVGPAVGASPLGQNGQNGQNSQNGQTGIGGPNPQNGSTGGFGSGQNGSSGFGSSSSVGGSSSSNSGSSSFDLSGGTVGEAPGGSSSSSQSDFGWPPSGAPPSPSADAGQAGGSWDTTATSGLPPTGSDLSGTQAAGSPTSGAGGSINSLSPAALHAEEPGRPLDANGKPKMSPDCIGGSQNGNQPSSFASSTGSSASSSNSSSFSSFMSSSSSGSPASQGSFGSSGVSGSSGFSSSSQSSSSFGSLGSSGGPIGAAIAGIASCSDQASLRTYNKHHRYSEWEFLGVGYNPLGSGAAGLPQGTVQPGQPGQPGQSQQGQGSSFGFGSTGTTNQPGSPGTSGSGPNNPQQPPTTPQPTPTPPSDQPEGP